jgi:glycerol uptake facilitator-like aquaporin
VNGVADIGRRAVAEFVGTALLLAVVVGSGIAGERFSDSTGLALLVNAFATGAGLVALILALGPVSGAHFNPAVTLCDWWLGGTKSRDAFVYVSAQLGGAFVGVVAANAMYGLALVNVSDKVRSDHALWGSEALATFGLLLVIWGCVRAGRSAVTAFAVGGYIAAAYFFTSSTSFANPAVTLARTLSDTFAGIRPGDVAAFLPAQLIGAFAATALMRWLYPALASDAAAVVIPHQHTTP